MADNLLKAVLDAIAESDNELGGTLLTRLSAAHIHGQDNASVLLAAPTVMTSLVDIFEAWHVGRTLDILEKDAPTGNQGSYEIVTVTDAKNVVLQGIDGAAASFVDEDNVQWRFADLLVESTLEFQARDKGQQLWVAEEPIALPYAGVDQTPGAQKFLGIGAHTKGVEGQIAVATPTAFKSLVEGTFEAGDVGKAFWTLPAETLTGNEGVRVIASVVDDQNITLSTAFVADELNVRWFKKTYAGDGYLTELAREDSEVVDGSRAYSSLDQLRRALLVEYADGEELDRIGRSYGVTRRRGMVDEIYRRILKVLCYLDKTTIYAIELVLAALYPAGGWSIYEDLESHPCEVFINVPLTDLGSIYEGRTFLEAGESLVSATATTIATTYDPITVISVTFEPFLEELPLTALPSAETPAWTYINDGAAEGTIFSAAAVLVCTLNSGTAGGRYEIDVPNLETENWDMGVWVQRTTSTVIGGLPWKLIVEDGEVEVCLMLSDADHAVGQSDETIVATDSGGLTDVLTWYRFDLRRRGSTITAYKDLVEIFSEDVSGFGASGSRTFTFGYVDNGSAQNNITNWQTLRVASDPSRNYWNLRRDDGATVNPGTLNSAAALFVAGDTGNYLRLYSDENKNDGLWLATYVAAGQVTLAGIPRDAAVNGVSVLLESPRFSSRDVGKNLVVSGSALGNDGTYPIVALVSPYEVTITGALVAEDVTMTLAADFVVEAGVRWELVEVGTSVATALTLRDALPAANTPVKVSYSTVLTAQLMLNEFVTNTGEGGSGAPDLYYPFYLFDVDSSTSDVINEITAAGVIPRFTRIY